MAETISKTEAVDKLITQYSNNLRQFKTDTEYAIKTLKLSIDVSSQGWSGSGYEAFKKVTFDETGKILTSIQQIDSICERLDELSKSFEKINDIMSSF